MGIIFRVFRGVDRQQLYRGLARSDRICFVFSCLLKHGHGKMGELQM